MKHGSLRQTFPRQWLTNGAPVAYLSVGESLNRGMPPALQGKHQMWKMEKDCNGPATILRLSGRIQSDDIASIQSVMGDGCPRKILDLSEVTLVDLDVIRFLMSCEDDGIELVQCPAYVREWILRERAE